MTMPPGAAASETNLLRWAVERRMTFIERRLFWDGRVNRNDIVQRFGVSINQASADLARYMSLAPDNLVYDRRAKRYIAGPSFQPRFGPPDATRYLSDLRLLEDGAIDPSESWLLDRPPAAVPPLPPRPIAPDILQAVLAAIRQGRVLHIVYQSFSALEPRPRTLVPHALGFDGLRWHCRALDREDDSFKDFALGRMSTPQLGNPVGPVALRDEDWNSNVTIAIGPHPGLSPAQRKAVELDYGMENGRTTLTVRRALLYYTLKRLGVDGDAPRRPPEQQPIVLLDQDEPGPPSIG